MSLNCLDYRGVDKFCHWGFRGIVTWRRMYFLTIFLVALTCTGLSKPQAVFSIEATLTDNTEVNVELNVSSFNEFYTCLCDKNNKICTIKRGNDGRVSKVESCSGTSSKDTVQHSCEISLDIVCEKYLYGDNDCSQQNIGNIDFCGVVSLEWTGTQQVKAKSLGNNITLAPCTDTCNIQSVILATYPVSPLRPVKTTPTSTPTSEITYYHSSSTTRQHGTAETNIKDDNDSNDNMAVIIGPVIGAALVVVIVVTIIIILLRRKQKATTNNNNKHNNTDIYPYGETSLTNGEENLPPPPHGLSPESTYYNTIDIIGANPTTANSQAVNKNTITYYMNTINGEETGSSPGHDTSGYEEVVSPL